MPVWSLKDGKLALSPCAQMGNAMFYILNVGLHQDEEVICLLNARYYPCPVAVLCCGYIYIYIVLSYPGTSYVNRTKYLVTSSLVSSASACMTAWPGLPWSKWTTLVHFYFPIYRLEIPSFPLLFPIHLGRPVFYMV